MEKWQLSGIMTNDTQNKLVIPKKYLKAAARDGMISRLFDLFLLGAKKLGKVTALF